MMSHGVTHTKNAEIAPVRANIMKSVAIKPLLHVLAVIPYMNQY